MHSALQQDGDEHVVDDSSNPDTRTAVAFVVSTFIRTYNTLCPAVRFLVTLEHHLCCLCRGLNSQLCGLGNEGLKLCVHTCILKAACSW